MKIVVLVLALLLVIASPRAWADADQEARDLYAKICSKCHGLIQEDKSSWRLENLRVPVVTLPLGPTLDGIYMRPAGSIEGYSYSRAFRELATGWVWDEDALDGWLTNSQEFVRGSTMWLKLEEPARSKIIAYLKKYAPYVGE